MLLYEKISAGFLITAAVLCLLSALIHFISKYSELPVFALAASLVLAPFAAIIYFTHGNMKSLIISIAAFIVVLLFVFKRLL